MDGALLHCLVLSGRRRARHKHGGVTTKDSKSEAVCDPRANGDVLLLVTVCADLEQIRRHSPLRRPGAACVQLAEA